MEHEAVENEIGDLNRDGRTATSAETNRAIVRLLIFSLSATDRRAPLRLLFYLIGLFPTTLAALHPGW
jgi:hypothetical protein